MNYIEKTTDFKDEKKLKKYIRSCIKYRTFFFSSKIIEYKYLWVELFVTVSIVIFGYLSYMEMSSGILQFPIYKSSDFPFVLISMIALMNVEFDRFYGYFLVKKFFIEEIDICEVKTFIFEDGIEVFARDLGEAPIEIPFREMKDMRVFEEYIVCSVKTESGRRKYQCIYIPVFSLTSSEQFRIREWYRAQTMIRNATRSKNRKWLLIIVSLFSVILGITIGIDIGMDVSDAISETINEEQNREQTPIDLTDEEKLIEIINERKFYRDRCSFYADVVSYMENVRGVTDIGNLLEPIYRTNEVYYTKEDFENEPSLITYIAKNEIYARHGYQFKNPDLDNYFRGMVWYEPLYTSEEFDVSVFNDYEWHNLKILSEMDTYERN